MSYRIIISAGGTAGHVYPALCLAAELASLSGAEIRFVASGLSENVFFRERSFPYDEVLSATPSVRGVKRFLMPFRLVKGIVQSFFILRKQQPRLVIGFGSFHTFPVLVAAFFLSIPIYLPEQNICLGKVNRFFRKKAVIVASHFPETDPPFRSNSVHVGMPLRFKRESRSDPGEVRKLFHLDPDRTTVLVAGGSSGALAVNALFIEALSYLEDFSFQVIHLIGKNEDEESVERYYRKLSRKAYVRSYDPRMEEFLTAADFMVTRAGAGTIAEQIEWEKPAILIPYPYAYGHQEKNADFMEQTVKGGIKLSQGGLTGKILAEHIMPFLRKDLLQEYVKGIQLYKKQYPKFKFTEIIQRTSGVYDP